MTSVSQLDFFGKDKIYFENKKAFKFCLKKHDAIKAGLHFDLRLQINDHILKSFAVFPGISNSPGILTHAKLVDDHDINAFRREGVILDYSGEGAVIHFDEGYYSVPGSDSLREIRQKFEAGLQSGKLNIVLDGYRMKGEYHLVRKLHGSGNEWTIQKANDQYVWDYDTLSEDTSILSGVSLVQYKEVYKIEAAYAGQLNKEERTMYISKIRGGNFNFNGTSLPPRPGKIFPYE